MTIAHRFIGGVKDEAFNKSAKRTAEFMSEADSFSAVRFTDFRPHFAQPTAKALGYSHSVRFADANKSSLGQSRSQPLASKKFYDTCIRTTLQCDNQSALIRNSIQGPES